MANNTDVPVPLIHFGYYCVVFVVSGSPCTPRDTIEGMVKTNLNILSVVKLM